MGEPNPLSVEVVNTSDEPVPVVIQGREIYQESRNAELTTAFFNFPIAVPAGKPLIINSASARVRLLVGARAHASVSGNFSTEVGAPYLSLAFQGTFEGSRPLDAPQR
jgi:hypothetical protein